MRVISGQAKGRRLVAPLPATVRPTADRVKEALFSIVFSRGGVQDWVVADLFCGSGALGIEARSRGAAEVVFVDNDLRSIKATEENLVATGLGLDQTVRVRASLPGWSSPRHFDLVIADPPYAFTEWPELLSGIDADLVVAESDRPLPEIPGWQTTRARRHGTTLLTVLEPLDVADDAS